MEATLDHVQLAIPRGGEGEARAFYGQVLGLHEVPKPPALAGRGGCWFELGGAQLHLGVDDQFVPARKAHPAFRIAELSRLAKRLEERGYAVTPDDAHSGVRRFYTSDPFGNRLEFLVLEFLATRPDREAGRLDKEVQHCGIEGGVEGGAEG